MRVTGNQSRLKTWTVETLAKEVDGQVRVGLSTMLLKSSVTIPADEAPQLGDRVVISLMKVEG